MDVKAAKEQTRAPIDAPEEPELVDFYVNLAPNAENLSINGQAYWHGKTYRVAPDVARSLNEMAGNTWKHEAQINGESENQYRRKGAYGSFVNRRRLQG